ncbi:uncharacterized protein LOC124149196 [Haliotis rufescens]|uniref:uncharacterized protein LOC124149196 n=1 Tax=Haliotis rufescens TaxID=6454 RepID=UPI001EAFCAF7|nr:uncharacterized protein LOC124149196 [Haliotis rufescens]
MEKQYSQEFFASFVEQLQQVCRNYLNFSQFVEVSGYVCVEIDNMKKERYVLSELLQSSGNVVSESYCTKAFKTLGNTKNVSLSGMSARQGVPLHPRTNFNRNNSNYGQSNQRTVLNQIVSGGHGQRSEFSTRIEQVPSRQLGHGVMNDEDNGSSSSVLSRGSVSAGRNSQSRVPFSQLKQTSHRNVPVQHNRQYVNADTASVQGQRLLQTSSAERPRTRPSPLHSNHTNSSASTLSDASDLPDIEVKGEEVQVTLPQFVSLDNTRSGHMHPQNNNAQHSLSSSSSPARAEGRAAVWSTPLSSMSTVNDDDDDEIIDLDLFEDDLEESLTNEPFSMEDDSRDVTASAAYQSASVPSCVVQKSSSGMSPGSKHVMKSAIKQFQRYHSDKCGQDIDLWATPPEQLNDLLLDFYQGGRTLNGKELTPGSLKNVQIYLDKYLREGGYPFSLSKDEHFKTSRDFIKAKVHENSKFVVAQRHIPVNDMDIEILFQTRQLGSHSPESVINTMWVLNSKFFAIRRPSEHFNLKWGDIALKMDDQGHEYLERQTKGYETFALRVFANSDIAERCFVNVYKQYKVSRPKLMLDESSAFYLKGNKSPVIDVWFLPDSMSWCSLINLWKKMVTGSGLPVNKKIF